MTTAILLTMLTLVVLPGRCAAAAPPVQWVIPMPDKVARDLALDEEANCFVALYDSSMGKGGVAKYSADGTLLWTRFHEAPELSDCVGVVTHQGAAYVAGSIGPNQQCHAFVAKYSANGDLIWRTTFSCTGMAFPVAPAIHPAGRLEVAGTFTGNLTLGTMTLPGEMNFFSGFLGSLSLEGVPQTSRSIAAVRGATLNALSVGEDGSRFVEVSFEDRLLLGAGLKSAGDQDIAIAKFDPADSLSWVRRFGGSRLERCNGLVLGSSGDLFMAVDSQSSGELVAGRRIENRSFWAKLASDGQPVFTVQRSFGTSDESYMRSIDTGWNRNLILTAEISMGTWQVPMTRAAICSYGPTGNLLWSILCQGQGNTQCHAVREVSGQFFFLGSITADGSNRASVGNFILPWQGNYYFLAKAGEAMTVPEIAIQPGSVTMTTGGHAAFTVQATGPDPLTFQWFKNGVAIPGATGTTLTLGNVSMADAGSYTVRVTNPGGSVLSSPALLTVLPNIQAIVSTLAGSGVAGLLDSTNALDARFNEPNSPAVSPAGVVFVADTANHAVRFITPGGAVGTLAGGTGEGLLDGFGAAAQFRSPLAVALSQSGDLFVADSGNDVIRRVEPTDLRTVRRVAGRGTPGLGDGAALAATFDMPNDLVEDAAGNVFITEFNNHVIRRLDPAGNVTVFAGNGTPGYADGRGTAARFNSPAGITIDAGGNLLVTEWQNHRVRKILPDGTVSTLAGTNLAGLRNGPGAEARFDRPDGIVAGRDGWIYVADFGNHALRAIMPSGYVLTLAGQGTPGYQDGPGSSALFQNPSGVAMHPDGSLVVTESFNHRVRRIRLDSTPTPAPDKQAFLLTELHPALSIHGRPGTTVRLEESAALSGWQARTNLTLGAWQERWIAPRPAGDTARFYRPVEP